jgi:hypothetical protein
MHGFRVLTEGVDMSDFEKNPVMLWMHERADGSLDKMPIGFWDELKLEGDNITGIPNFDDNDPLAMKLYHKVEHGTIRAASAGILPVQLSDNPKDMLPGQTLPTFKKSKIKEGSLCDIGSNAAAVTLYSQTGQIITLSAGTLTQDFKDLFTNNLNMEITSLNAPAVFALLKLDPKKATEADALAEVQKIVTLAAEQSVQITTLSIANREAKDELVKLKADANEGKIATLVSNAIAERKITAGQKDTYIKLAASDFETTKELLDGMKGNPSLQSALANNSSDNSGEVADLVKLGFDELWKTGKLATLKALDMGSYKLVFKAKYGKEPAE